MTQRTVSIDANLALVKARLLEQHPGRHNEISSLFSLFLHPSQPLPSSVHLQDSSNGSLQAIRLIKEVLSQVEKTFSLHINPLTCPSTRHVFARLSTFLDSLDSASKDDEHACTPSFFSEHSLDSLMERFGQRVRKLRKKTLYGHECRLVIVIEQSERMRDVWPSSLSASVFQLAQRVSLFCVDVSSTCIYAFLREANKAPFHQTSLLGIVGLVTISTLGIHHFRSSNGSGAHRSPMNTISIPFGRLEKSDACSTLLHAFDPKGKGDVDLFVTFVSIAYDTFASDIRDIEELRQHVMAVWPSFIQPVLDGKVSSGATQTHIVRGTKLLREALTLLHDPGHSTASHRIKTSANESLPSLSLCASFMMLASFLASYNPSRLDVRYFLRNEVALSSRGHGPKKPASLLRKKGGAVKKQRRGRPSNRSGDAFSTQSRILGPRSFTLDRLLSVFQSLVIEVAPKVHLRRKSGNENGQDPGERWETNGKGVEVLQAVNSLLKVGYLVRTSLVDKLDVHSTLRTNVGRSTAERVANDVGVSIEHYFYH